MAGSLVAGTGVLMDQLRSFRVAWRFSVGAQSFVKIEHVLTQPSRDFVRGGSLLLLCVSDRSQCGAV